MNSAACRFKPGELQNEAATNTDGEVFSYERRA